MVVELQHVVAVSSNIVCSAAERHEEEETHRALKPQGRIQRKGNTSQR